MKNRWYNTDVAFSIYAATIGFIISCFDSSLNFSLKNVSLIDTILNLYFAFIVFQIKHNHSFKSYMDGWFRNIRRISEDPYKEYDRETIISFLRIIVNAQKVYSVDRNNPDTWFLNDNYITFLCLEEELIKNSKFEAHRIFIWREECYYQSRYQQLLLLNVYAGINTYIVTLEFLQRKRKEFEEYLNKQNNQLLQEMNTFSHFKDQWLDMLINNSDGEEFLLCERDGNIQEGIGKVKTNSVRERSLYPCECKCYKIFFDWILTIQENGEKIALLKRISSDINFPTYWKNQIEEKIKKLKRGEK